MVIQKTKAWQELRVKHSSSWHGPLASTPAQKGLLGSITGHLYNHSCHSHFPGKANSHTSQAKMGWFPCTFRGSKGQWVKSGLGDLWLNHCH